MESNKFIGIEQRLKEEKDILREIMFAEDDLSETMLEPSMEGSIQWLQWAEWLAHGFGGGSDEEVRVAYRSLHFMTNIARLSGAYVGAASMQCIQSGFSDTSSWEEVTEHLSDLANTYIHEHPEVASIIAAFMPEIDHYHRYGQVGELSAALFGYQLEEAAMIAHASQSFDGWDGLIPADFYEE